MGLVKREEGEGILLLSFFQVPYRFNIVYVFIYVNIYPQHILLAKIEDLYHEDSIHMGVIIGKLKTSYF